MTDNIIKQLISSSDLKSKSITLPFDEKKIISKIVLPKGFNNITEVMEYDVDDSNKIFDDVDNKPELHRFRSDELLSNTKPT